MADPESSRIRQIQSGEHYKSPPVSNCDFPESSGTLTEAATATSVITVQTNKHHQNRFASYYDGDSSSSSSGAESTGSYSESGPYIYDHLTRVSFSSELTRDLEKVSYVTANRHAPWLRKTTDFSEHDARIVSKRKSHRKSKTGCITCRQRRVKCDEQLPVCTNCVRHRVRCGYESLTPDELRDRYLAQVVDRLSSYLIRNALNRYRPFTSIRPFQGLTNTDIQILQHVSYLSTRFMAVRPEHVDIWKEVGIQCTQREPFVLHAFLSLGSAHAGYLARSPDLFRVSLEHKQIALRGAQEALSSFSRENAETVLAVSMLLSWQSFYTEDRDPSGGGIYSSLALGIETVLDAMKLWREDFPLSQLYYNSMRPENWPPPFSPENFETRLTIFKTLLTHLSRLQPLCGEDATGSARTLCFVALQEKLAQFIDLLSDDVFGQYALEKQMQITEKFTTWQKFFVPQEAGPSADPSVGRDANNGMPISNMLLAHYANDPFTRLLFGYFYCTSLLVYGLWPQLRRSKSFLVHLGPLEGIIRELHMRPEWWIPVEGYSFFAERVIQCYKIRSWVPVIDTGAQIQVPVRLAEVLWYGISESLSLNTLG
ncbi:hypothetical protein V1514DRAFT_319029 [Lipomyces japonicus]|uniref:uncharacterized protein n=1 Tax=Lipomyces japonicus TaxID=56871 RepID=UPI0034CEC74D